MNELNIYTKFNYKKIVKNANIFFDNNYNQLKYKTVFANKDDTFTVSIYKHSIRICYWNENTEKGNQSKILLKKFLVNNFSGNTLIISTYGNCDIINQPNTFKTIQLM